MCPEVLARLRTDIHDHRVANRRRARASGGGQGCRASVKSLRLSLKYPARPVLTLGDLRGLIVIDEVQRRPDLFPVLRVLVDRNAAAFLWLESFIRTFLERDLPALGVRVPGPALRRFWVADTTVPARSWICLWPAAAGASASRSSARRHRRSRGRSARHSRTSISPTQSSCTPARIRTVWPPRCAPLQRRAWIRTCDCRREATPSVRLRDPPERRDGADDQAAAQHGRRGVDHLLERVDAQQLVLGARADDVRIAVLAQREHPAVVRPG